MADWTKTMQQTFEFYTVNPDSWKDVKLLNNVKSCTISRDATVETLGSATIEVTDSIGESYIRVYLITIQNGVREKHPLGTFLVQTPSSSYDGKVRNVTMDAYTPLLELKENHMPIGYSLLEGDNIMDKAYTIVRDRVRAPVVAASSDKTLENNFVSNTDDTGMTFVNDLIRYAEYSLDLDEMGRVLFKPDQETESLQPVWTYTDNNSSILMPELELNHDIYGIPNVVEVVYTYKGKGYTKRIVNDSENSPISTVNRGRELVYRDTNPSMGTIFSLDDIDAYLEEYGTKLLKQLSSVEYKIKYTHGYCPVRLGDCIRLNYTRAGLTNIKAKVISQSIKCSTSCQVTETAVFTTKLWR